MARTIAGIGDEAVTDATGEPWAHWLSVLDDRDGTALTHKERVAALADAGVESGWWRQTLAVGYERERGLREVGETADAGFQVGVQRTLPVARDRLWSLLTTDEGLETWLGDPGAGEGADWFVAEPAVTYETDEGTTGEVRTVSEGERLRLTWQPASRAEPTTLQLSLACPRNDEEKTTLRFHHEKLADADEREAMRDRWRSALDRIESLVADRTDA